MARSTITRELRRGSWQPEADHANARPYLRNKLATRGPHARLYLAGQAHLQAKVRAARSHRPYRMRQDRLVDWVLKRLEKGWSPRIIAGRLRRQFPGDPRMRVSHETLYQWIYAPEREGRALWQYLPRGQHKRRRRHGRGARREHAPWRVSIHDRPAVVEDRAQAGHWEADSVLGVRGTGALHTEVERTSRYLIAVKIPRPTAAETLAAQLRLFRKLPAHTARSVTCDNGSEFARHYRLADTLGIPTYFADPYSAWQRGSNEHFNGQIRRYLPKGTSFEELTQAEVDEIVAEINDRPLQVLDWATPAETFHHLCSTPTTTTSRCTPN